MGAYTPAAVHVVPVMAAGFTVVEARRRSEVEASDVPKLARGNAKVQAMDVIIIKIEECIYVFRFLVCDSV